MKKILVLTLVVLMVLAGCSAAGGDSKLGLGIKTVIDKSKDLAEQEDGSKSGTAQVDTTIAAVMVDADGKVIDVMVDTAQTRVNFNEEGVITSDKTAEYKTKRDLGNDYGMIKASGIGREWFEQMDAIQEWMKGKTASEIAAMKVKDTEEHGIVPDEPDLTSKATMGVETYLEVVAEALANAN